MGVKGLQSFIEQYCPENCAPVDLREMARQHVRNHPPKSDPYHGLDPSPNPPTLVVDGMACVRQWYSCSAWVHGGQWKQFLHLLKEWVGAFTSAGIRLVFFFDGVVEEQKRAEWVKRRQRVNRDISKLFSHVKRYGQQPGRELFCLPSGLATFSCFALRSLGQEVHSSVREADYEVAAFALQHDCMGILGQDTDFLIYDSVPYLSVSKLRLDRMTTVLYSQESLCHALRLHKAELPLLACLLGNDVVPEERMQGVRREALTNYRQTHSDSSPPQREKVLAVAHLITSSRGCVEGGFGPASLNLSDSDRQVLKRGVQYYLLPGQQSLWGATAPSSPPSPVCVMERHVDPAVLQAVKEKHMRAECFIVYNVLYGGIVECSNTLEDEEDEGLVPQTVVFQPCRELIYGILLPTHPDGNGDVLTVKEWFVSPGSPLKQPNMVYPAPLNHPGGQPDLKMLWFGQNSETSGLRLTCFLSVFGCEEFSVEQLEGTLLAVLCLVTYITKQVGQLSLEDVDAYLSQAVCLRSKSPTQLQHTTVPHVDSRAVQLGSLFVRGLTNLLAANSACGEPLPMEEMMPWHSFDGLLFHSKYLMAHAGTAHHLLLEDNASWLSTFFCLREKVLEACRRKGRTVQSIPRLRRTPLGQPVPSRQQWGSGDPQQHWERRQTGSSPGNMYSRPRPRSRHPDRQRYRLAPRWTQYETHPGPGPGPP